MGEWSKERIESRRNVLQSDTESYYVAGDDYLRALDEIERLQAENERLQSLVDRLVRFGKQLITNPSNSHYLNVFILVMKEAEKK